MSLLTFTTHGIYCPQADVYIDPWKKVEKALITHGHSDHARYGHKYYMCTKLAAPVIKFRLGKNIKVRTVDYGEVRTINGVKFSFHPAGHIIGSAQIRVEYKGEVWVASGDYKTENDGLCTPIEIVPCHTFITESTFGLPVYKWEPQETVYQSINQWWKNNAAEGKVTLITGYSLGKSQRIIHHLDDSIGQIFTHAAIENTNEVIRNQGIDLRATTKITERTKRRLFPGSLVIAPPTAVGTAWTQHFEDLSVGAATGWMALRKARKQRPTDRGFILSDHADWDGLNQVVKATGASRIFVTHGYSAIYAKYLRDQGYDALEVKTAYEGEMGETIAAGETENA